MADQIKLKLGDFTFTNMGIPNKIPLGGEQRLVIHELVGGTRIVDAMGKSFDPIKWTGLLMGTDALANAKFLDQVRKQGKALPLFWSSLNYTVIIQQFLFDYEREYQIPYIITCVVIADAADQQTAALPANVDQTIQNDAAAALNSATALTETNQVPASGIMAKVQALKDTIGKIRTFAAEQTAQIAEIKNQVQDVQTVVSTAIASVNNTLQDVTTLGGILPSNPLSMNAAAMMRNVAAVNNATQLMNLKYSLEKINKNVSAVNPAGAAVLVATVTVMSGTLFALAAKYYGDAGKWGTIATANGLKDPYITQELTLIIPKVAA